MDKIPRGRPPRSKNVLTKHDSEPQVEEQEHVEEPEPEVKPEPQVQSQVQFQVKEKKPRSEKQQEAMKKMVEANKAKRQIKIVDPQVPKPIQIPESNKHDEYLNMFKQMNDRLNQFQPKKEVKVKEKEVKTPKPKKIQKESSEEEESESDDEYVERYKQKAEKRFEVVKQIEQRLQQVRPKGKYDHISLFQ